MKKSKKSIGILGMLLMLSILNFAAAADYCWLQMGKGDKVHISQTDYYTCTHTTCQICAYSSNNWYASWNKCQVDGIAVCSSGSSGGGGPIQSPLTLDVVLGFKNGDILTKQTQTIEIKTNKVAAITMLDNIAGTQSNLCANCVNYRRSFNFKQGLNNITIRAVKGNEVLTKTYVFFVDNQKPRISKVTPEANKYANKTFTVSYNEENVKTMEIYYGTGTPLKQTLNNCLSGKNQICSIDLDLTQFDGKQINYWFVLTDIANNVVQSRTTKVNVDVSSPKLLEVNVTPETRGGYVKFSLKVDEKNLNKIYYYDNGDTKGKVLCSTLKNGICSNRFSFKPGEHNVIITAVDKAGNSASTSVNFSV
jgi:hypothetical protein